jgi:hypothetical protein
VCVGDGLLDGLASEHDGGDAAVAEEKVSVRATLSTAHKNTRMSNMKTKQKNFW